MTAEDLLYAIGEADEELLERSEQFKRKRHISLQGLIRVKRAAKIRNLGYAAAAVVLLAAGTYLWQNGIINDSTGKSGGTDGSPNQEAGVPEMAAEGASRADAGSSGAMEDGQSGYEQDIPVQMQRLQMIVLEWREDGFTGIVEEADESGIFSEEESVTVVLQDNTEVILEDGSSLICDAVFYEAIQQKAQEWGLAAGDTVCVLFESYDKEPDRVYAGRISAAP